MGRKNLQKNFKASKGGHSPSNRNVSSQNRNGPVVAEQSNSQTASLQTAASNLKTTTSKSRVSQFEVGQRAWAPSTYTAFKAILSSALCSAIWSNISDCDETFNYWEPTHYLIYKSGLQTWEYSPTYAIRSYAYLLIHTAPGWLYAQLLQPNKVLVFYFIRCILAFACAGCEAYFYKCINSRFGGAVARLTLAFLLFAPGLFISRAAFLPSSFSMYFTMLATGAWLSNNLPVSIMCVAISSFVGWPFAAILGISIAVDILIIRKNVLLFAKWSILAVILILVPLVQIDSAYFGKLVVAPLNIVLYNIFSSHGPELYGTEPASFYFVNGFLNFNLVFVAALMVGPALLLSQVVLPNSGKGDNVPAWLAVAPMYIWFLIFFTTPHKEERFLYPAYPLICLSGSMFVHIIEKFTSHLLPKNRQSSVSILGILFTAVFAVLSISRSLALYRGYHAPFDVYMEINRMVYESESHLSTQEINLCVGKEWYRYPSSFFLPPNWHLQFIQSEFRGQLPKPYAKSPNATAMIPDHMNDRNQEETSRYVDIRQCHFLVDMDIPVEKPREPRYSANKEDWDVLFSVNFLDATRSSPIFRAFYIPWLTEERCSYSNYNLLKSKHFKAHKGR